MSNNRGHIGPNPGETKHLPETRKSPVSFTFDQLTGLHIAGNWLPGA